MTKSTTHIIQPKPSQHSISEKQKYNWVIGYCLILIGTGFLADSPINILKGLWIITTSPSNLLTDYIEIANLGSTLVNSGLLTLLNVLLAKKLNIKMNGALTAALYTLCGFSFFGKNLFNSLPILIGVYLYAKWSKKPYAHFLIISLFGTGLAPAISEISFDLGLSLVTGLCLGVSVGILIGFILTPLSVQFLSFHQGFSLYNIGFTLGIIGMFITSVLRVFDFNVSTVSLLSSNRNTFISLFLYGSYIWLFLIGYFSNQKSFKGLGNIFRSSGKLVSDYVILEGYGATLMNMALLGIGATSYVLLVGGTLSGPVIGGIYTVVGFGAYGAHLRNTFPIVIGVVLLTLLSKQSLAETSILLSVLFGTTLAPVCGFYGIGWGIVAGMLHVALVNNVGFLHGGLNLYNNGFSGGFVAAFMVPILDSLHLKRKKEVNHERRKS